MGSVFLTCLVFIVSLKLRAFSEQNLPGPQKKDIIRHTRIKKKKQLQAKRKKMGRKLRDFPANISIKRGLFLKEVPFYPISRYSLEFKVRWHTFHTENKETTTFVWEDYNLK